MADMTRTPISFFEKNVYGFTAIFVVVNTSMQQCCFFSQVCEPYNHSIHYLFTFMTSVRNHNSLFPNFTLDLSEIQ